MYIYIQICMYCTYAWVWQRPLDQSNSTPSISHFLSLSLVPSFKHFLHQFLSQQVKRSDIYTHTYVTYYFISAFSGRRLIIQMSNILYYNIHRYGNILLYFVVSYVQAIHLFF